MKKILILIGFLYSINSFSQSTVLLRGDTIRVYKQGGDAVLKVDSTLMLDKYFAGALTDSVLTWNSLTRKIRMRDAASFAGSGSGGYFNPDQTSTGNTLHNGNNHDFVVDSSSNITYHLKKDHDSQFDIFASQGFFAGIGEIGSSYYGYYDLWPTFNEIYLGVDDGETMINQTPHSGGAETLIWSKVSGAGSFVGIEDDRIYLDARNGNLQLGLLTNLSTQNRLLGQFGTSTQVGYVTLSSMIDLVSGVLIPDTSILATQYDLTAISTPTLQQVTTAGNSSTNSITIKHNSGISILDGSNQVSASLFRVSSSGGGNLDLRNTSQFKNLIYTDENQAGNVNLMLPNTGHSADTLATLSDVRAGGGGSGTVTSVSAGFGTNFTTITSTGSVIVDTTSIGVTSWVRTKKVVDSLGALMGSVPTLQQVTTAGSSSSVSIELSGEDVGTGHALFISNANTPLIIENKYSPSLLDVIVGTMYIRSNNAGNGISGQGIKLDFVNENDAGVQLNTGSFEHILLDATAGSLNSKYIIRGVNNAASTNEVYLDIQTGGINITNNGTDTLATKAYARSVGGGGGGSGTVNTGASGKATYYPGAGTTVDDFAAVDYAASGTNMLLTTQNTTDVGLEIKGQSSQSANFLNISSSSGTGDIAKIASSSELLIGGNSDLGDYDLQINKGLWISNVGSAENGLVISPNTSSTDALQIGNNSGTQWQIYSGSSPSLGFVTGGGAIVFQPAFTTRLTINSAGSTFSTTVTASQGATTYKLGGSVTVNTTDVGNVGAGEDDLMTYSVPAGLLAANGDYIEFTMSFDLAANANTKQVKVKFGATTIYASGAQAQNDGVITITGQIIRTGAATQRITYSVTSNATLFPDYADYVTAGETLSGAVTLKATGEATSNDDIIQKINLVKFLPNN